MTTACFGPLPIYRSTEVAPSSLQKAPTGVTLDAEGETQTELMGM